jgi:16S rRNA (uracil1498-N3)-methyltransferase
MSAHVFRFIGRRIAEGSWELGEEESVHLQRVLRLETGSVVEICDGAGWVACGQVAAMQRSRTLVHAETENFTHASPGHAIAIGALKPADIDDLIAPLTELGIAEIAVFLQEGAAKARVADKVQARWTRLVDAAIKQCKRPWRPSVTCWDNLDEFLNAQSRQLITLDPDGEQSLSEVTQKMRGQEMCAVIGGEKGLSAEETSRLRQAGSTQAKLGAHVLRARTAAVAAAAHLA